MIKKLAIAVGAALGLLLTVALVTPFVVDVDRYRPHLVREVNRHLNGKFDLGRLKLTLWGKVKIEIEALSVQDARGKDVLKVDDAYFYVPFESLLKGAPLLTLRMNRPNLSIVRNQEGQVNLLGLYREKESRSERKASPTDPSQVQVGQERKSQSSSETIQVPAILSRSRLGLELRRAKVFYQDLGTGLSTEVNDLNLIVKDFSLSKATQVEFWAELDTRLADARLKGPLRLRASLEPKFTNRVLDRTDVQFEIDANQLVIEIPGTFRKSSQVRAELRGDLAVSGKALDIRTTSLRLHQAEFGLNGKVKNLQSRPQLDLKFNSGKLDFAPWAELIAPLREFDLGGGVQLAGGLQGPTEQMKYSAKINLNGLSMKTPLMETSPVVDGVISIETDKIDHLSMTLKAPETEVRLQATVDHFLKPKVKFRLSSTGINLDRWLKLGQGAEADESRKKATASSSQGKKVSIQSAKEEVVDFDKKLDGVRDVSLMANASVTGLVDIKKVQAYGVLMTQIVGNLSYSKWVASWKKLGFRIFGGTISSDAELFMAPKRPTYRFDVGVKNFDIQKAVSSQLELFKNTATGVADFSIQGKGQSLNPGMAKRNLNAKGKLLVRNASFSSIDVGQMTADALNRSLDQAAKKVPALRGKKIRRLPKGDTRYRSMTSGFKVENGTFVAPQFVAIAEKGKGVDLKGATRVGLVDRSLAAKWWVTDTYNMTKGRDVTGPGIGGPVSQILVEPGKGFRFPVTVKGTLDQPVYDYGEVAGYFAQVALKNVSRSAKKNARARAEKKVNQVLKKQAPEIRNAIKKLRGKLF